MALVLIGLGLMAVVTQQYFGSTSKLGGANVFLAGRPAVLMGLSQIALGCAPLALWFRVARVAAWWAGGCLVVFGGLLFAAARS